jgi:hypothetical protein
MNARWDHIFSQMVIWLVAEIVLNLVGLDNLADYSEFVFNREIAMQHYSQTDVPTLLYNQPNVSQSFT